MTLYSYRIGDTKQGRLVFTTDKNLKKDFPKTFGISKSAMILDKFDSVGLYKVLGMERERDFQADLSVDDFPSTPMFTNKRVLVIGNGSSLLDNECGDIIDSYDIVIRINHCLTKGIEKYVGTKTDIWATTHLHYHKNPNKTTFYPSEKHNVKVVWKRTSNVKKIDMSKFNKNVNLFTMFKRKDNYDVMKDYNWKNLKIKHEPCTGLLTICTALKFFKNVDVIGFDFYTDSDKPTDYYREFELDKDGNHLEDKLYQKQIEIGFCSKDIGKSKLEFLQKLEDDGYLNWGPRSEYAAARGRYYNVRAFFDWDVSGISGTVSAASIKIKTSGAPTGSPNNIVIKSGHDPSDTSEHWYSTMISGLGITYSGWDENTSGVEALSEATTAANDGFFTTYTLNSAGLTYLNSVTGGSTPFVVAVLNYDYDYYNHTITKFEPN